MYNFDKTADRTKTSSLKWMYDDVIPLWVADMDFDTMPSIKDVLKEE